MPCEFLGAEGARLHRALHLHLAPVDLDDLADDALRHPPRRGRPLIGTLTTVDRYALVRGDRGRMLTVAEALRLSSFPAGYVLAGNRRDGMKQTGNCVPPLLAAHVIRSVCAAL